MAEQIKYIENPSVKLRNQPYLTIEIDVSKALKSWKSSLYSFEWLDKTGAIKPASDLKEADQERRALVERQITQGQELEMPILGIGMLDNVEIGTGKAVFLTVAAMGQTKMPVHIMAVHEKEFEAFIV